MSQPRTATFSDSRRTRLVWSSLVVSSTVVCGALLASQGDRAGTRAGAQGPAPAVSVAEVRAAGVRTPVHQTTMAGGAEGAGGRAIDRSIAPRQASIEPGHWKAIVIHHSGSVAGSPESISRQHVDRGLAGLGHHFVIGNGNGMGDGAVHVGYRWDRQLPGAHLGSEALRAPSSAVSAWTRPVGLSSEELRHASVSVCLVGHGDRREFTPRQERELLDLVKRLQSELGIPAESVFLASDLDGEQAGPGAHFPVAWLESQLVDAPVH